MTAGSVRRIYLEDKTLMTSILIIIMPEQQDDLIDKYLARLLEFVHSANTDTTSTKWKAN